MVKNTLLEISGMHAINLCILSLSVLSISSTQAPNPRYLHHQTGMNRRLFKRRDMLMEPFVEKDAEVLHPRFRSMLTPNVGGGGTASIESKDPTSVFGGSAFASTGPGQDPASLEPIQEAVQPQIINTAPLFSMVEKRTLQEAPDDYLAPGLKIVEKRAEMISTANANELASQKESADFYQLCPFWGSIGECNTNPIWMKQFCAAACSDKGGIKTVLIVACIDYSTSCPLWASVGECDRNPFYMLWQCAKSCNACTVPGFAKYPQAVLNAPRAAGSDARTNH